MASQEFKLDTSESAIQGTLKRLSDAQSNDPPARRPRQVQLGPAPEGDILKDLMTTAVVTTFYGPTAQLDQFKACVGDAWGSLPDMRILQTRALPRRGMFFTKLDSHLSQLRVLNVSSPIIKGAPSVTLPYLPEMDSTMFVSPIRPTWIELVNLPSFITQSQLLQLISNVGAVVRIPYVSQKLQFASVRALILWDFRQPLIDELRYEVGHLPFRLKLKFLELGEPCGSCGFSQQSKGAHETAQHEERQPMEEEVQSSIRSLQVGGQVKPRILALQELHVSKSSLKFIKKVVAPQYNCFAPDPIPATGGTVLLVHKECECLESFFHPKFDFGWVLLRVHGIVFGVVTIYSPNCSSQRRRFWKALRESLPFRPWILVGDHNMVESAADASGESPILKGAEQMEFQRLVSKFNLVDSRSLALEAWGPQYTRCQNTVNGFRWSVLDRFYLSQEAGSLFSVEALAHHSDFSYTDHFPISLSLESPDSPPPVSRGSAAYFKVDPSILTDPHLVEQLRLCGRSSNSDSPSGCRLYADMAETGSDHC
ncbi:hypothetical protein R1sor_016421 [Riccia sorocarpa]|uniref:Endonuclease/exonuclease/phosphatase domain-containing protein n=1 Tax=Riccia sorocarpa TaxID=122646 RepID=A0ABD3HHQ2_9MARC